jgi:hypothetical protein
MRLEWNSEPRRSGIKGAETLVECKDRSIFTPFSRRHRKGDRYGGFPAACSPDEKRTGSSRQTASQQRIQFRASTFCLVADEGLVVFGGDETRI